MYCPSTPLGRACHSLTFQLNLSIFEAYRMVRKKTRGGSVTTRVFSVAYGAKVEPVQNGRRVEALPVGRMESRGDPAATPRSVGPHPATVTAACEGSDCALAPGPGHVTCPVTCPGSEAPAPLRPSLGPAGALSAVAGGGGALAAVSRPASPFRRGAGGAACVVAAESTPVKLELLLLLPLWECTSPECSLGSLGSNSPAPGPTELSAGLTTRLTTRHRGDG